MKVKIVEQVYALTKENERRYLLNRDSLRKHKSQGHNFIHIGLIQIAVKPSTMKGINSSILLALRDARFRNYSEV